MDVLLVLTNAPHELSEEGFNRWYDHEHVPERVAIPGVWWAARYVFASGPHRYGAFYALEDRSVLDTPEYRGLADQSTWSEATRAYFPRIAAIMRREVFSIAVGELLPLERLELHMDVNLPDAMRLTAWCDAMRGRAILSSDGKTAIVREAESQRSQAAWGGVRLVGDRIAYAD